MKTFYLLAAVSSAEIVSDTREPEPYCCILYAAPNY